MNLNTVLSFPSESDLLAYRRVKINGSGNAEYAVNTDVSIGTVLQDTDASVPGKDMADVQCWSAGLHFAIADTDGGGTPITVGGLIAGSTAGTVKLETNAQLAIGQAVEAATADDDVIRVHYFSALRQTA